MSLVLDNIGLRVGQETIIDSVSLTARRGTMNVLLGPTLAGKDVTGIPVWKRFTVSSPGQPQ